MFHPDEYVVFVTPSKLQKAMFAKILQPGTLSALISGSMAKSLAMISLLTKLSNSPMLLKAALEKSKSRDNTDDAGQAVEEALELIPSSARLEDVSLSGKIIIGILLSKTNNIARQTDRLV